MQNQAQIYDPLPDRYVRFVEILSGTFDAPLRCKIFTAHLEKESLTPFEAVSYVWGEQEPSYELLICNDTERRILHIGSNLHDALLHFRLLPSSNTHSMLLWVDRICINQDDVKERASQVLLMRYIYRKCRQVLVWLGRECMSTEEAFECACYIHKNALGRRETPWRDLAQYTSPAVSLEMLEASLSALAIITHSLWFQRAWTFQ